MSSIITFYSYKGGVGRSMALANIAYELSKRNFKVLVVDWDLEAPGIERYFSSFKIENSSEGLLQLLLSFKNDDNTNYQDYLWKIDTLNDNPISLLHSGREKDPAKYSSLLQDFDWSEFFSDKKGGYHLEGLRTAWHRDFDFVLIDSRTGLSDSSGVCTIMMPDILVPMFTANYQSLFGVRDIIKYIQAARQKLEVDRMALTVLPIPSRFGTRVEFKESIEWLERIADILKDCYSDWLPKWIEPKYILEQIKIPQIDYFSFGEKLAVVEQVTNDPEGMGFIFSKIATLLSTDFSDIENFVGRNYYQTKKKEFKANNLSNKKQAETEFLYDVYISYSKDAYQWVRELLIPALIEYLNDALGYNPRLFFDINEFDLNESISLGIETVIQKSKTCVFVVSDSNADSKFLNFELSSFSKRERNTGKNILFPIKYSNSNSPNRQSMEPNLRLKLFADFSGFNYEETIKSTMHRSRFAKEVEKLATAISNSINQKSQLKKVKNNNEQYTYTVDNFQELLDLAREYDSIRATVPSGNSRTRIMENIVTRMKLVSDVSERFLQPLTTSKHPGERLAAIAMLQNIPNVNYLGWLSQRVGHIETPFVGYQAAVALYIASRSLRREWRQEVEKSLSIARSNIEKSNNGDPNQVDVIKSALADLKNSV